MDIESLKLVCFSPTGTTKAIVQAISKGLPQLPVELIDITKPEVRQTPLQTGDAELLVVAVPVYMGRVPALLTQWLTSIQARNTPAVSVVVYGNRAYDDALVELTDMLKDAGGIPLAAAAYIGEHSFSSPDTPTAHGRPDPDDLAHAQAFGQKIHEKLLALPSVQDISKIEIPGNRPYGGQTELWSVDFISVSDDCIQCGVCAEACPVNAISPEDSAAVDIDACITCCACIKTCPQKAREMKPSPVMDAALRLSTNFSQPKAPEIFL